MNSASVAAALVCVGVMYVLDVPSSAQGTDVTAPPSTPADRLTPAGFRLVESEQGDLNLKLMTYVRYLNQRGLDETFTDTFGHVKAVGIREDIQLQKVNVQFNGRRIRARDLAHR